MITPYERALAAVETRFGRGSAQTLVQRCDASADGALTLTLGFEEGPRCFSSTPGEFTELSLDDEHALPAVPALLDLARTGGARILSWRPARRVVARVHDDLGPRIVKGYRRGRSQRALDAHMAFRRHTDTSSFALARILKHDHALDCVHYEILDGRPLALTDDAPSRGALFSAIGRKLGALQRTPPFPGAQTHTRADELVVLDQRALRYVASTGSLPIGFAEVRAALDGRRAGGDRRARVAVHRDLHEAQFSIRVDTIALLDFDLAGVGEVELDVANLAAHLHWSELRDTDTERGAAGDAERALCQGLSDSGASVSAEAMSFYKATTALRLALIFGLRPRTTARSAGLVNLAAQWMDAT